MSKKAPKVKKPRIAKRPVPRVVSVAGKASKVQPPRERGATYGTTQHPAGRQAQWRLRKSTQDAAKSLGIDFGVHGQKSGKSFSLLPEAAAYQSPAKVVYQVVQKGSKILKNRQGKPIRRGHVKKQTTTKAQSQIARTPTPVLDNQAFWKQQKKIKIKGYPRTTVGGKPKYDQQYGVTSGSFDTVELSNLADVTRGEQGDVLGRLIKKGKVTKTGYQTKTKGHFEYPDDTGFNPFKKYIAPKDVDIKTSKPLVVGKSPGIKVKKGSSPKQSKNRKITEFGVVGGAAGGVGLWEQFTSFFNQPLVPEAHAAVGTSGIAKQIAKLTKEVDAVKDGKKMFISDEKRDNYVKSRFEKIAKLEQKLGERFQKRRPDELHGGDPIPLPGLVHWHETFSSKPSGTKIVEMASTPKSSIADDVILPGGNVIKTVDINPALDKGFGKVGKALKKKKTQRIIAGAGGFGAAFSIYPWLQTQGSVGTENVGTTNLDRQIAENRGKTIPPSTTLETDTTTTPPGQRDLLAEQTAMSASLLPTASGSPQPTINYGLPGEYGNVDPSYTQIQGSKLVDGKIVMYNQWVKMVITSGVQKEQLQGIMTRQASAQKLNVLKSELNTKMQKAGGNLEVRAKIAQSFYKKHPELGRLPTQYTTILNVYSKQKQVNPSVQAIAWQRGGPYTQGPGIVIRPQGYADDLKNQQQTLSDQFGITTYNLDGSIASEPKKA